jgi:hypothetical protein
VKGFVQSWQERGRICLQKKDCKDFLWKIGVFFLLDFWSLDEGGRADCTRERERERAAEVGGGLIYGKMKANIWVISEGLTKNVTFPIKTQFSTSLLSCTATAITVREKERESESVCFSPICERSRERNDRSKRGSKRNQAGKRSAV